MQSTNPHSVKRRKRQAELTPLQIAREKALQADRSAKSAAVARLRQKEEYKRMNEIQREIAEDAVKQE
jgi:hypothetical protein